MTTAVFWAEPSSTLNDSSSFKGVYLEIPKFSNVVCGLLLNFLRAKYIAKHKPATKSTTIITGVFTSVAPGSPLSSPIPGGDIVGNAVEEGGAVVFGSANVLGMVYKSLKSQASDVAIA